MLSLMMNICLAGQPCKEVRIADFFTAQASVMCEFNRAGMQEATLREKRQGTTYSCKAGQGETKIQPLATLDFKVCAAQGTAGEQCDGFALAQFYGKEFAAPACAKNAEHMRPNLEQAANGTGAAIKLDCRS